MLAPSLPRKCSRSWNRATASEIPFHEDAERDLTEGVEYYDLAARGLGDRLLVEVRVAVAYLEAYPMAGRILSGDIRGKPLVRFPHTLLYAIENGMVLVLALAHQRRTFRSGSKLPAVAGSPANILHR